MSNDPFYRAGQETGRKIKDERQPPPQSGRVLDVDTIQKTAHVQIGAKTVTAYYFGPTPPVGEQVVVQQSGPDYLLFFQVQQPAYPPGSGALTPPSAGSNTSFINELWLWGHSYVGGLLDRQGGYGTTYPRSIDDYLFGQLGLTWPAARNLGRFGAKLCADVPKTIMGVGGKNYDYNPGIGPYLATGGCHALIYGTNDLGQMGDPALENGRALTLWGGSVKAATAWLRLGAAFDPLMLYDAAAPTNTPVVSNKAGVVYTSGTWAHGSPVDDFVQTYYPYATLSTTTSSGATFQIKVPADHPGTDVWLFFVGERGAASGAANAGVVYPGGGFNFRTDDIVRSPAVTPFPVIPEPACVAVKVPMAATGAVQTITVSAGTLGGARRFAFMGWGIECVDPKLITWGTIPVVKYWAGGGYNTVSVNPGSNPALMHWPSYPDPVPGPGAGGNPPLQTIGPNYTGVRSGDQDGDTWAVAYDTRSRTEAALFKPAGSVIVADLSTTFSGVTTPELFRDLIHPNEVGNEVLGVGLGKAMNLLALAPLNLTSSSDYSLAPLLLAPPPGGSR